MACEIRAALRRLAAAFAFALLLFLPQAVWANCGGQSYNWTVTSSSNQPYNINSGQSLRIQGGTYTGSIGNLASNGRICVDSGATFTPSSFNNPAGEVVNYGTINFGNVNLNAGFRLDNFAKATFTSSANFNGAVNFNNRANAELIFRQTVQFSNNSVFNNDGTVRADGNFNLQENTSFTNSFEVVIKDTFNPNGIVNNYGRVRAEEFININAQANARNYCSWIADAGFNNNSSLTENYGMIYINWTAASAGDLWQNNATFKMGPDAIVYGWRFFNNALITNTSNSGGGKFYMKQPAAVAATEHTKNQQNMTGTSSTSPIIFFDETQSNYTGNVSGTNAAKDAWIFDQPYDPNLLGNTSGNVDQKRAAIRAYQMYSNVKRQSFTAPPIDYAAPTCSAAIRQVMYDPNPPSVTYDYSDAPTSYGTPYHEIRSNTSGVYLGNVAPDWDGGGFNTPNADGDDLQGNDDEDGIASLPTFQKGQQVSLSIKARGGGYLGAWIDYNGDGDFADSGEQVATNVQDNGNGGTSGPDWSGASDNIILLRFTPPANAAASKTYLRLRWSLTSGLGATANATSGEIEDYDFTFGIAPEPELPPGGGGGAGGGSTASSCPAPQAVALRSGNAVSQTSSGTVANAANALGAPAANGAYATATNAAKLGTSAVLTLDLIGSDTYRLPGYSDIILSIARVDATSRVQVQTSVNGTSWTTIGTYGANGTLGDDFSNGILKRVMFEAPSAGARYVRLTREAGEFWVDGVMTQDICGVPASLTIVKSSQPFTSGDFMVPGKDVAYTILVSNSGTLSPDADSVFVVDTLPPQISFSNAAYASGGTPVLFTQNNAGLNFSYATDVRYSNAATPPAAFGNCAYTPAAGYDPNVKHICIRPTGSMAGNGTATNFQVKFRARIK